VTAPPSPPTPPERAEGEEVPGAPSDNETLMSILADLRADGHGADLRPKGDTGELVCSSCATAFPAEDLGDLAQRRLEGASDPDDMVLVVTGRCPSCDASGVLVVGFGPNASVEDSTVVAGLP
jgi:hypothetical protein